MGQPAPGGFLAGVMGFVRQHPLFSAAAPLAFLPANLLEAGLFHRHPARLLLFNFVQQEPPGDESIKPLLARFLALDLQARWAMEQHDAGSRFVDILPAMSARPDKSLFNIGLAHPQGGHPQGELLFLFWLDRKRIHPPQCNGQCGKSQAGASA